MGEPGELTELLARASAGDADAWNAIVERFASLLWAVARGHRLSQDDAADVVQNTWLKLLDHLDSHPAARGPGGLALDDGPHECLSILRRGHASTSCATTTSRRTSPTSRRSRSTPRCSTTSGTAQLWSCFVQLPERCQVLLRALMASDRPNYKVSLRGARDVGRLDRADEDAVPRQAPTARRGVRTPSSTRRGGPDD